MIPKKSNSGKPHNIKIAAPINSSDEIDTLAANGANEFYCGIVPDEWINRYGHAIWLSRRGAGKANLPNFVALDKLIEKAHTYSIPVYLTLNAQYYTEKQLPFIIDLVKRCCGIGMDGLIVSDIGLILGIIEAGINIDIVASSVAAIHNSEAAEFFYDIGIKRIVFPRHVSLDEIRRISNKLKGVESEVFILNDGCVYEEGFCSTTHAAGPFCTADWSYEFCKINGSVLNYHEREKLNNNLTDYKEWIWFINNCGCSLSEKGLPNGPCGLCTIYDFYHMGVYALKIVGREASTYRKLKSLQMVKAIVEEVKKGGTREDISRFAIDMKNVKNLCRSGYMCYYREPKKDILENIV